MALRPGFCNERVSTVARMLRCDGSDQTKQERRWQEMDLMTIIWWLVFGAIIGVIARFLMPGPDPMGGLGTIILGIIGSFIGGFLSQPFFAANAASPPPISRWIGSIIGALVALAIYRYTNGRRVTV